MDAAKVTPTQQSETDALLNILAAQHADECLRLYNAFVGRVFDNGSKVRAEMARAIARARMAEREQTAGIVSIARRWSRMPACSCRKGFRCRPCDVLLELVAAVGEYDHANRALADGSGEVTT